MMLTARLISKRCSSLLSFSKYYFMQECCFMSLNVIRCAKLFSTLDLGRNEIEGKKFEAGDMLNI